MTRGGDTAGLLRYLYGPGRANEHVNPHLVASWLGDDRAVLDPLEPTRAPALGVAGMATRLNLPLRLLPDLPDRPVWQCSMRTADGDRRLTDSEWAAVAREVVERTGFAPAADPGGCRWVAIRHANNHIHLVVVLARQDGGKVDTFRDWPKVHVAARAVEKQFGLQQVTSPDRTATPAPSRAERERATRLGKPEPARRWLARQVRVTAASSFSQEQFAAALSGRTDLVVAWRFSQQDPGEVTGYRVGRVDDLNTDGQQVWFSGSKLAPDLSLPRLQNRWSTTADRNVPRPRQGSDQQRRRQVLARAERALGRAASSTLNREQFDAAADSAAALAGLVEADGGGPLTEGAERFARASRERPGGDLRPSLLADDLRLVAAELSLLTHLLPGELRYAALIAAHLARITSVAASSRHDQPLGPEQRASARRASDDFDRAFTKTMTRHHQQRPAVLAPSFRAEAPEPRAPAKDATPRSAATSRRQ